MLWTFKSCCEYPSSIILQSVCTLLASAIEIPFRPSKEIKILTVKYGQAVHLKATTKSVETGLCMAMLKRWSIKRRSGGCSLITAHQQQIPVDEDATLAWFGIAVVV